MSTPHRVRAAYWQIGLHPASAVDLDEKCGVCCPAMGACLAKGRPQQKEVRTKRVGRQPFGG
jgi:hypothetical protein